MALPRIIFFGQPTRARCMYKICIKVKGCLYKNVIKSMCNQPEKKESYLLIKELSVSKLDSWCHGWNSTGRQLLSKVSQSHILKLTCRCRFLVASVLCFAFHFRSTDWLIVYGSKVRNGCNIFYLSNLKHFVIGSRAVSQESLFDQATSDFVVCI